MGEPPAEAAGVVSAARCRHFGTCGGCALQDLPYAEQLARKQAALAELLGRAVEVTPAERPFGYRTRMDYVYAWGKLGLRKRGDPRGVLDLEECLLLDEDSWAAVRKVKEALLRLGIRSYSYVAHKGYLRYVVVRAAPVRGERMLVFLTNGDDPAVRALLDEAERGGWADGLVWSVTTRRADVSFGEVREVRGRGWIEEQVGDLRLRFGPNSFFQSNPWTAARLYAYVARYAEGATVDLFCGVGGLGLAAAERASSVLGLDSNAESILFAKHNAEANGLEDRVRFTLGDARRFLADLECDTLLLDPPRSGCGDKNVRKILRAGPERVVYVSCNPKVLARELPAFEAGGYRLRSLQGFDLFPQTPHVEVVAVLERATRAA